ncbi:MAG: SDR family oxidoreductase, partial [Actinobacteria bacterium]|nr:SDR family oxidoreductase [Actinomycetota bacterium]
AVVDVHDLETLRSTIENNPEVDLVVNVVGGVTVPYWHRLHDYPIESFDHLLTTNLRYAFTSCQAVAARLIADARPGAMVNISSIASKGQPLLAGYGAAKAGLDSLTRSMAMEWGRHGIRVNNVAPGTVNTPRSGRPVDDPDDPLAKGITLGRRGTPTDIANRVLRNRLRRLGTGRGRPRRPRPDRACGPHGVRQCAARPDRRSTSRHEVGTRSDA